VSILTSTIGPVTRSTTRLPVIIFDLGGVLVENVTLSALGALLAEPTDIESVRGRWLASDSVRAFELGRVSADEFAARFIAEWDLDLSPDEFLAEFDTWPRAFWPESLALLAELRARHTVACLSNCNERHWRRFGGFTGQFDVAFSSHLLGRIKPDRDVFELVLERLAVRPGDALYFDDSPACVEAAHRLGIRAHLVGGPAACRRVLEKVGVL
jgi:HAD superfamily hydrolase (TIGR01509 family)